MKIESKTATYTAATFGHRRTKTLLSRLEAAINLQIGSSGGVFKVEPSKGCVHRIEITGPEEFGIFSRDFSHAYISGYFRRTD